MRLIYPADTFRPKVVDETYEEEYEAVKEAGFSVSLFNFEEFQAGSLKAFPPIEGGEVTLYRGWMMTGPEYTRFHQTLTARGATPLTTLEEYLKCHHLPGWYDLLKPFTAETRFYTEADDIAADLESVGWTGCFLKDYVKSLSTDGGSVVSDLSALESVIQKMRKYRGQIEGGLCARHLEDYDASLSDVFSSFVVGLLAMVLRCPCLSWRQRQRYPAPSLPWMSPCGVTACSGSLSSGTAKYLTASIGAVAISFVC